MPFLDFKSRPLPLRFYKLLKGRIALEGNELVIHFSKKDGSESTGLRGHFFSKFKSLMLGKTNLNLLSCLVN